jgi:spore coat polysaccharide biosynthesis protein SpsF
VTHVQIPFNVLDSRWFDPAFIGAVARRADVTVHTRSAYLQGLLLAPAARWPAWCTERETLEHAIDEVVRACGRQSRIDLCLAYVRSTPFVRSMVLGFETPAQLAATVAVLGEPAMSDEELAQVRKLSELAPPRLLNPALW